MTSRMIAVALRGMMLRQVTRRTMTHSSAKFTTKPGGRLSGKTTQLEVFLISICFGLLTVSGIVIAVLLVQIKELKMEVAHKDRTIVNLLDRAKIAVPTIAKVPITTEERRLPAPITLSSADVDLIHHFIKVLAPEPGVRLKIHLGDKISNTTLAPLPRSLVEQLPRLHGAKFLIDQNGSIAIVDAGSNRAEVLITPE
jgi:hypothetical protein